MGRLFAKRRKCTGSPDASGGLKEGMDGVTGEPASLQPPSAAVEVGCSRSRVITGVMGLGMSVSGSVEAFGVSGSVAVGSAEP